MTRSRHGDAVPDNPWNGADEVAYDDGSVLQLVGVASPTRTAFGRLLMRNGAVSTKTSSPRRCAIDVLRLMLEEIHKHDFHDLLSATELLQLGSVWRLSEEKNQKYSRARLSLKNANDTMTWTDGKTCSLRVHFFPSRFPATHQVDWKVGHSNPSNKPTAIVHHDQDLGFTLVNKPSGVPSHATVDNYIENALYQLEIQQSAAKYKPSLTQRLDIETSGLILVANCKEFSSYMGKLLEQKTVQSEQESASASRVKKRYKCLVHVSGVHDRSILLERLNSTGNLVTHYMDPKSKAPKTFEDTGREGWLKCLMKIMNVGPCMQWLDREGLVMEVQIDLLTGRTHQIRGQMKALHCPLVGDPLYGTDNNSMLWQQARHSSAPTGNRCKLGLQCCSMSFPKPEWGSPLPSKSKNGSRGKQRKERQSLVASPHDSTSFHLEDAWWTECLIEPSGGEAAGFD